MLIFFCPVFKEKHISDSALINISRLEVPKQALDGILLDLGSVVKINLLNFHVLSVAYKMYTALLSQWSCDYIKQMA